MSVSVIALDETTDPPLRPLPARAVGRELLLACHVPAPLSRASGRPVREVFLDLDETLTRIGETAGARLAWQAVHPVHAGR
ncbi:hypothetical protein [Streptomyces acidiscabies]|uniref:hypothetical protein n=1 Tax=Streptomyces acidiscabies TaxID=42234 RepID=UPI0038F62BFC